MKSVIVVSPEYLKPMVSASANYTFQILGYSYPEVALKHLRDVNVADIKGVALLFYELPIELYPLCCLINTINKLANKIPIVLVIEEQDDEGLQLVLSNIDDTNIDLYILNGLEAMTDEIMKRDIYGTIVRSTESPYLEESSVERDSTQFESLPILSYDSNVPKYVFDLMEPVLPAEDCETALASDNALRKFDTLGDVDIYRTLRALKIYRQYNKMDKVEQGTAICTRMINKLEDEKERYFFSNTLELIKRGDV